ncbi:hypothetical protein, partial [Tanticharoenia sakaeratensis]|uniref:hypothetical protein n=2 Tax=Tanticharoenia sakaeratensis TaxID=444053 RepID=UPI00222FBC87
MMESIVNEISGNLPVGLSYTGLSDATTQGADAGDFSASLSQAGNSQALSSISSKLEQIIAALQALGQSGSGATSGSTPVGNTGLSLTGNL